MDVSRQAIFVLSFLVALNAAANPPKPPAIVSPNGVTFQAGQPSSFSVTTTGTPPPSISETGALPAGITFADGRGNAKGAALIAGNAVQGSGGKYPLTLTASNPHGSSTQNFTLTVCNAIQVAAPSATTATAGFPFQAVFTETGAVGGAIFSIASGALLRGLTLATDGTVSGTPTATGTSSAVVQVIDSNGAAASLLRGRSRLAVR